MPTIATPRGDPSSIFVYVLLLSKLSLLFLLFLLLLFLARREVMLVISCGRNWFACCR